MLGSYFRLSRIIFRGIVLLIGVLCFEAVMNLLSPQSIGVTTQILKTASAAIENKKLAPTDIPAQPLAIVHCGGEGERATALLAIQDQSSGNSDQSPLPNGVLFGNKDSMQEAANFLTTLKWFYPTALPSHSKKPFEFSEAIIIPADEHDSDEAPEHIIMFDPCVSQQSDSKLVATWPSNRITPLKNFKSTDIWTGPGKVQEVIHVDFLEPSMKIAVIKYGKDKKKNLPNKAMITKNKTLENAMALPQEIQKPYELILLKSDKKIMSLYSTFDLDETSSFGWYELDNEKNKRYVLGLRRDYKKTVCDECEWGYDDYVAILIDDTGIPHVYDLRAGVWGS